MSNEIDVSSDYGPVSELFPLEPIYRIPKYQRSYSWEQPEIEAFLRDLKHCYDKRKMTSEVEHHFFGQIVCISKPLYGTAEKKYLEIVDGQQRLSTFILLASAIIHCCKELLESINGDMRRNKQIGILQKRIADLKARFIQFSFEFTSGLDNVNVLELSKHDKPYFNNLLDNPNIAAVKPSNQRLTYAYKRIFDLTYDLTHSPKLDDHIGNLKTLETVLLSDFFILKMVTNETKAAFKLFQVLNNRGKSLTEGDLLRAETLRILENYNNEQETAEAAWDTMLMDHPGKTALFLRAIYSSYTGKASDNNSFFVELQQEFLPEHAYEVIEHAHAQQVIARIQQMEADVVTLRKIWEGQWCYPVKKPIEYWDRNRLYLLIHGLGHVECLPFLLAAQLLDHKEFNEVVRVLELFVFRYVVICKLYIGELVDVYNEESKYLRENRSTYKALHLQEKLRPLQAHANDEMFRRQLDDLQYYRVGKSNKPLKYFLLCIEYFYAWYKANDAGLPTNSKEKVHDFNDMSIEHIYPYAANATLFNADLEPFKNQIGNLTLLGNEDNKTGDNDDFLSKVPIYKESSMVINREWLALYPVWTLNELQHHTQELKDMACKIFTI